MRSLAFHGPDPASSLTSLLVEPQLAMFLLSCPLFSCPNLVPAGPYRTWSHGLLSQLSQNLVH